MMEEINNRIKHEFCKITNDKLSDKNLLDDLKNTKSVKRKIKKLEDILKGLNIEENIKLKIIDTYTPELIPPGTKGVIRGLKFNSIVKEQILNMRLDQTKFEIQFEKKCELQKTDEIPDWFILEKNTNKVLIGMNQMDFTTGGHQKNRGYKYLINNKHNSEHSKFLCVICNYVQFKSENKSYILYKIGFSNNTLCYIKNLEKIINSYFSINTC